MTDYRPKTLGELAGKDAQRQAVINAVQDMQEKQQENEEKRYKRLAYPLSYLNKYMTELARLLNSLKEEIDIPEVFMKNPEKILKYLRDEIPDIAKLEDEVEPVDLLNWLKEGIQISTKYKLFHEDIKGNLMNYRVEKSIDFSKRHDFSLVLECVPEKRSDVKFTFFDFRSINQKLTDKESFLRDYNIEFNASQEKCNNGKDVKVTLEVENKVDIKFQFTGNEKTGLIDLKILNFGGIGEKGKFGIIKLAIVPNLINARLVESLAAIVLRRPSELFKIAEVVKNESAHKSVKQYVPKRSQFKKVNLMKVLKELHKETQETSKIVKNTQQEVVDIKVKQEETQKTVEEIHLDQKKHTSLIVGWTTSLINKKDSSSR